MSCRLTGARVTGTSRAPKMSEMGKNNRQGSRNKDALQSSAKREKKFFEGCAGWMAAARETGRLRQEFLEER